MRLKCSGCCCWLVIAMPVLFTSSCQRSEDGPKLGKVTGVVMINNKPVPQTRVLFEPKSDTGPSWGTTDAEGKFEVYYTLKQPGAVVGRHRVQFQRLNEESKPAIPKDYTIGSAGLEVEIQDGPNEFQFDLTKK